MRATAGAIAPAKETNAVSYTAEQLQPLLAALQAARDGDFSVRLPVGRKRDILSDLATAFNEVLTQNESMANETVRIASIVGREGHMTERASLPVASGSWKVKLDSINQLIEDLARPTTEVARVITAVAEGDLSQKMALEIEGTPVKGEFLRIGTTVNTMVDQLNSFAAEVTRMARDVGTEGKLGGQALVPGVSGTWKELTDNVNGLATNLTDQVRNIAKVTTAVANGDLSQKITVDAKGEILELKTTINRMVDQLSSFAAEVTRVAKEVGTEGQLGGQANVEDVSGTWRDLTDSVNIMALNLTSQVRGIAKVVTAVANGDLKQKFVLDAKGEVAALADTINSMTETLSIFAEQVTSVAREVGTEGKLGGQAKVPGVSGTWKDLTESVNGLASNLTDQVRNIALVTTAIAKGDLSQKITVDASGEVLALKNTINTMVDQLSGFAAEVTRVAKEVGTDGELGGQAKVPGVSGTWKDLTDSVNGLASNLTNQVRNIALVTTAIAQGDLSQKITVDVKGEVLLLKNTINRMVDQLSSFAAEVTRVAREVGTEGILGGQARVPGVTGTWKELTDNVNGLATNLTNQVRNIGKVTTAVANGDLSQKITVDASGEVLELKTTINRMVDQLSGFADEVTRVAREVGTEGQLGGQAKVPGVSGTWKDLTDNVNFMALNLTRQVRGIARVVTAVANGDLKQKFVLEAMGEYAALAETINGMIDTLSIFADQVTTVAREVGTEGKLGGQAKVPGVSGTWKELTDNVNFMANSLTAQVRAISDVATAVTKGDLTRFIAVDAQGEVQTLMNNINQMIANLKDTTEQNQQQDWLKTNLARFSSLMQGQKTLESVTRLIMNEVTPLVSAKHGVFFLNEATTSGASDGGETILKLMASYGYRERKNVANVFQLGEGLVGQCALEKQPILLKNVPSDYIQINSGLGEAAPLRILVLPILFEGKIMGVIELASFEEFSQIHQTFLEQLAESIGVVLNMISANLQTQKLLVESQSLTQALQSQSMELQDQQDRLKRTNAELEAQAEELEEKAEQLAVQNERVEMKNREVELAKAALEERAEQLAIASRYKSEFLANMSHELRTPLNSMLILAKLLADNAEGNLSKQQEDWAATIRSSGVDLKTIIDEILDLSRVEAGKMAVSIADVSIEEVRHYVERTFDQMAKQHDLSFKVVVSPDAASVVRTDPARLQQILRNLLGNAFKFTERGGVTLEIRGVRGDTIMANGSNLGIGEAIAFSVTDTGIGIPKEKQRLIFEPFQQADGTTSRRYGGTGLGLSISQELTKLLGGRIDVVSQPGEGSTFTLYLPVTYAGPGDQPPGRADDVLIETNGAATAAATATPPVGLIEALKPTRKRRGKGEKAGAASAEPASGAAAATAAPVAMNGSEEGEGDQGDMGLAISLAGRTALVVDDDFRNIFALTSVLESWGMHVLFAENGVDGIQKLADHPEVEVVLMDVMMPEMDGYETTRRMRQSENEGWRDLPIIALTAKAMSGDREKCLQAGASDYIAKPVDTEKLLWMLRQYLAQDAK